MRRVLLAVSMWIGLLAPAMAGPLHTTASAGTSAGTSGHASDFAWVNRGGDEVDLFDHRIRLDLPSHHQDWTEQSIDLRMGEALPEGLSLRLRLAPWATFAVSADLSDPLPRLDAVDGESYWAPGFEVHVTKQLTLFVEDFQPTSALTGGGNDEFVAPQRSWDGHQVSVGARLTPHEQVVLEGAVVVYTLSASERASDAGGVVSVSFSF